MRVVLTGGGTGGHTTPLLPIVEVLRRGGGERVELFFMGVVTSHIKQLLSAYDISVYHIPAGKLRRYASALHIVDLFFRLPVGIILSLFRLWWLMPDVVVSKGGYGSIPTVLAAWFYRIPILIHESDVAPGLANKIAARVASIIAVSFSETQAYFAAYKRKVIVTGIPVRFTFDVMDSRTAKQAWGFTPQDIVVLVTGGSQGAEQINEVVLKVLPQLVTEAKIIHVTGAAHFETVKTVAEQLLAQSQYRNNYRVYPVLTDHMATAMSAADVIVSRAGATTLAEIARLRKASLLIPLPGSAQNNQQRNATIFEQCGAARVLDNNNLGPHLFHRSLEELITSSTLRERFSTNVATLDHPEAAETLADLTRKLAQGLVPSYTHA